MNIPEDTGLDGKVAIVAGGGARGEGIGNGRAAALLLAQAGAQVLVVDREEALAKRTAEMIHEDGGEAEALGCDVTDEAAVAAMVRRAVERFGRLDVLDNNVGIGSSGSVVEEPVESWKRVMRVNLDAMFLTSKYAIPAMIESGGGGAIVNIASIAGIRPRGMTSYSTSKGAVMALSQAMAVDHGKDGIRVNCIAPGPVFTPMVGGDDMDADARRRRAEASVLGIEGTGWDIGNAVVFLASDKARYITGQILVVDGGVTLRTAPRAS